MGDRVKIRKKPRVKSLAAVRLRNLHAHVASSTCGPVTRTSTMTLTNYWWHEIKDALLFKARKLERGIR